MAGVGNHDQLGAGIAGTDTTGSPTATTNDADDGK